MKLHTALTDVRGLDELSRRNAWAQRLDPRAALLTTLLFAGVVVSFPPHELAALTPLCAFPLSLLLLGHIPAGLVARRMALAAPFAVCVGLFNPFLDTAPLLYVGPVAVSGGWISFLSILLRFALTVSAALLLTAVVGFHTLCAALHSLGVPRAFVVQLLMLHRYLFVLLDEAQRLARARRLRAFSGRGMGPRVLATLLGNLLLRSVDRATRVHRAMCCRGFTGTVRVTHVFHFRAADAAFVLGWAIFFALVRSVNLPDALGNLLLHFSR